MALPSALLDTELVRARRHRQCFQAQITPCEIQVRGHSVMLTPGANCDVLAARTVH